MHIQRQRARPYLFRQNQPKGLFGQSAAQAMLRKARSDIHKRLRPMPRQMLRLNPFCGGLAHAFGLFRAHSGPGKLVQKLQAVMIHQQFPPGLKKRLLILPHVRAQHKATAGSRFHKAKVHFTGNAFIGHNAAVIIQRHHRLLFQPLGMVQPLGQKQLYKPVSDRPVRGQTAAKT